MTRRRTLVSAALVAVLALVVALTAAAVLRDRAAVAGPEPEPLPPSQSPSPSPSASSSSGDPSAEPGEDLLVPGSGELAAAGTGDAATSARPVAVRLPSIDVASGLEDLAIDRSGRLRSPRDWQRVGWFADGTVPGDVGPAVVAGHVDSPTGPAVFDRLDELEPGDRVEVERDDGEVAVFVVDRAEVVAKDDFPTASVYGPTPDAQLRLITCDGPYVRSSGGYQDNLVVYATEVTR